MGLRTPLYDRHSRAGAKIVDFGGWDMPLNYGSQLEEHRAVRASAGMFDVSHMTVVDISGDDVASWLAVLLANDVAKLDCPGKALYTCMLNDDGGVIDDLIAYRLADGYRLIVNAATRDKDLAWLNAHVPGHLSLEERSDLAMVAVQGPGARDRAASLAPEPEAALALKPFHGAAMDDWFVARTGYTGEDGFEILLPAADAATLWDALERSGVAPCGLGARDSLRLEAGLNLYGADMDESTSPLESNLAWTVSLADEARRFIGREAVESLLARGVARELTGLVLEDKGVLRAHQSVHASGGRGETTSGGFSPTLGKSIALARVPAGTEGDVEVDIRGRRLRARVVAPPFVRKGKSAI